jgi:transcriptional regulator of aromatic amino acid metabolism
VLDILIDTKTNKEITQELGISPRTEQVSHEIVGASEKIQRMLELVRAVAPSDSTVLIQGGSGTGKELIAGCRGKGVTPWSPSIPEGKGFRSLQSARPALSVDPR